MAGDDDIEAEAGPRPSKNRCPRCGHRVTWGQAQASFGRMIRKGFTAEEAKQHSPICSKCVTAIGREHAASESHVAR
jgi:hypothetical protein